MSTFNAIRARQLAAALSLLALLVLMPAAPAGAAVHREVTVVCVSASELAEQSIEELGGVDRAMPVVVPAPRSGRLRVREADRIGPHRLHLPPPAAFAV